MNRGSFVERVVMFCQKVVVFAALVCSIIIWGGLVVVAQSETLSDLIKNGFRQGLLLTGQAEGIVRAVMLIVTAVLVLVLLGAVFRHVSRAGKRRLYIDSAVLLVLMIAIYVFFLTQLRIIPTTDARSITDQAYTLAQTGAQSMDADSVYANYFSKYSNNYPFALFLVGFFRILLAVGVTDIWLPLYLLNMIGLLLGALFTWLTARKVLGLRAAVKMQLLMTLCPVYYLMMFWVYTTTLSVPFVTGMIYLAFCIRDVAFPGGGIEEVSAVRIERDNDAGTVGAVAGCGGIEEADAAGTGSSNCTGMVDVAAADSGAEENGAVKLGNHSGAVKSRVRLRRAQWIKLIALSVLAGLACSLGFLLRATNAIVAIATVICMLICIIRRIDLHHEVPREDENYQNSFADKRKKRKKEIGREERKTAGAPRWGITQSIVARCAAACLVAAIVAAASYSIIHSSCMEYFAAVSDGNYPITHWLMMGSHGDGMYNTEDDRFTFSLETAKEKQEATWSQTVANYKEAGMAGTLKLFVKKMIINWSDGYFAMDLRLQQSMKYSPVYSYIAGNHNDAFHLYCQGYWLAIGVLVIVACIRLLSAKSVPMLPFLLVLTLFGAMAFYLFWEVKPAYALPFLYVFYLLAVCGQEGAAGRRKLTVKMQHEEAYRRKSTVDTQSGEAYGQQSERGTRVQNVPRQAERQPTGEESDKQGKSTRRKRRLLGYLVVIFLGIEYLYNDIIDSNKPYYEYSIRCTQKNWLKQIATEDGDTVTQEFYPSAAFNRIVLSVAVGKDSSGTSVSNESGGQSDGASANGESGTKSNSANGTSGVESGDSESSDTVISTGGTATCLHITLQDADGTIVYKGVITQEDIDSDNRVTLEVGEQLADTQGGYLLSITKETGSFGNINLRTRKGISLNAYKGEFYINGVLQGTDLYMQVYRYC